jgi:hypothetical protein
VPGGVVWFDGDGEARVVPSRVTEAEERSSAFLFGYDATE